MGYVPYYLIFFVAQYLLGYRRYPYVILGAVVVYLLRRRLPDPYLFFKHRAHVRRLTTEIAHNPDNATARRELARIWLEKRRPSRAIVLIEEALRRDAGSLELKFLLGKALLASGRAEAALPPLVAVAAANDKLFYGETYLLAARALQSLRRDNEAEDALERYLAINSSTVEGRVRLACVRRELRNRAGARTAIHEAVTTFREVPRFRQRAELRWYLRAQLMSLHLI